MSLPPLTSLQKNYIEAQLYDAVPLSPEYVGQITMKIHSKYGETNWLNVSPEEYLEIQKILRRIK